MAEVCYNLFIIITFNRRTKFIMKKIISLFLCLAALFSVVSCDKGPEYPPVSVELNGGTLDLEITEETTLADVVNSVPTKSGSVFAGWYNDAAYQLHMIPGKVNTEHMKRGTAYAKWIDIPEVTTYNVRRDSTRITDSGIEKQHVDFVGISENYSVTDLRRAGYTSLKVKITLLVSEKDDGYQYLYLYNSSQCDTVTLSGFMAKLDKLGKYVFDVEDVGDEYMIAVLPFEHTPSTLDTSWKLHTLETIVPLSEMISDLYIRYDASGKDEDTWYNKELVVEVTPIGGPVKNNAEADDAELAAFIAQLKTTPEREGYIFAGWYSDDRFTDLLSPYYLTPAQKAKKTAYPKWIEDKGTVEYTVRAGEVTITDDGRDKQQLDIIRIESDFPVQDLVNAGYRYFTITLSMDVCEKNDGYQYVFIYSDPTSTGDGNLLADHKFDHGGSGVTGWSRETVTFTVYIDDLTDSIYIRYGASGEGDDTWYNKNVKVTITASK